MCNGPNNNLYEDEELLYWYEEWWEEEDELEDETCPEGYTWDECCDCVHRLGVESCQFLCPFKDSRFENCPYWEECLRDASN